MQEACKWPIRFARGHTLYDKKNKHRCSAPALCPHAATDTFNRTTTMNIKDLIRLGVPVGEPIRLAHEFIQNFLAQAITAARSARLRFSWVWFG